MSLGGYVAEKLVFGDLTTGPSNDLQVATAMARDMVTRYGMSDALGPIALEGDGSALYGRGLYGKEYSEEMGAKIDSEVKRIMGEQWKRAEVILTEKRVALESIAEELIKVENIEREDFEKLLIVNGIVPKKKEENA
jgi:cell division protease FtsH